jgi:hypothetical protein
MSKPEDSQESEESVSLENAEGPKRPDYQVGYGRPPVHSRFKPGVSGNPNGRRKPLKARDIKKDVQEVFLRELTVRDGNKTRRVTGIVLLYQKLLNDALKGNAKAALVAYKLATECGVFAIKDAVDIDLSMLSREERELCDKALELFRKTQVIRRAQ